ncbi:MAG: hypothetical protein JWR15_4491, partial [Prosthecobacter sp.]|nr:hypothetical protein [Prosthecobacter sp.]
PSLLSAASSGQDIPAIPTDENSGIVSALTSVSTSGAGGATGGAATNLNPRDIKFIDLPIAKNGKFGLVNPQPPYKLVDLWGTPYYVLLDTNGDKQVINPDLNNADPKISQNTISPPPKQLPLEIALYSWGQDLQAMTLDDVTSWRTK